MDIRFQKLNNKVGWILFLISLIVYTLTLEPTVSFWDCGEFILSAWKLQVGHPPGAPFFMILARVFSLFSFGNGSNAALMINFMSALASAFTIMFLYWTIVHLLHKGFAQTTELKKSQISVIIGSGIIGSLAYAFSDTFWFSAVEGEVYATSSLFTAIVFWSILKWENEKDDRLAGRWLVLIGYLMGLSIGVHLLNLLVLPAIVMVYYYKKYEVSTKGLIKALLIAFLMLGFLVFILLPYTVKVAGWFELLLVNGIGLPYNSGLYLYLVLLIGGLVYGIKFSIQKKRILLNYILTITAVILLGYSSYSMIMIRANAKPPMNQNAPSDVFSMIYYVNREQYGSAPLIKGNYYSAPVVDIKKRTGGYIREEGKYIPYSRSKYVFDDRFITVFPRMWSPDNKHHPEYEYWGNIKGKKVSLNTAAGRQEYKVPTFKENLRFFLSYQTGYMYWRYFMWNFSGRQNDIQGNGNVIHGNWISGISLIDNARLGDQKSLPADLQNNPGRNTYFFLPLILGILGMVWQYRRSRKDFWVIGLFFIMTGIAIVVYLNQYPLQPRERDYAYAASFYAFAIWIGLGPALLNERLSRIKRGKVLYPFVLILCFAAVPLLMLIQNWDDHDRSGRYTARDIGANYLNSCDDNAILFTYGDNDSFPVWYAQDVEGIRTDVRVANLSYLSAGWYIDMMRQKAYDSEALSFSISSEKYQPGKREQLPLRDRVNRPIDIKELVEFAGSDDPQSKIDFTGQGDYFNYIPASRFVIPVDSAAVMANGTVKQYQADRLLDQIIWKYEGRELYKNDLAVMDIIASNDWKRPIYYASTVPPSNYKGIDEFFQLEGLAYRIAPLDSNGTRSQDIGFVDSEQMYNNVMTRFKWGNSSDPSVYLDENNRRMFSNFRRMFGMLALALIEEGDTVRSMEVLSRCNEVIPESKLGHNYFSINLVEALFLSGHNEEATEIATAIIKSSKEYLDFIIQLDSSHRYDLDYPIGLNMQAMITLFHLSNKQGREELHEYINKDIDKYYNELYLRAG